MIFYFPKNNICKKYYWRIEIAWNCGIRIKRYHNINWDLNILLHKAIQELDKTEKLKIKDRLNKMQYITQEQR